MLDVNVNGMEMSMVSLLQQSCSNETFDRVISTGCYLASHQRGCCRSRNDFFGGRGVYCVRLIRDSSVFIFSYLDLFVQTLFFVPIKSSRSTSFAAIAHDQAIVCATGDIICSLEHMHIIMIQQVQYNNSSSQ